MRRSDLIGSTAGLSYVQFTLYARDLTAAAGSQAISLLANPIPDQPPGPLAVPFQIPAGAAVLGVKIQHSQSFTGGLLSAMTVSVGTLADAGFFALPFDVFQAPGDTAIQESQGFQSGSKSAVPVVVTFTATGDNVKAATQGSVDILICFLNLPQA